MKPADHPHDKLPHGLGLLCITSEHLTSSNNIVIYVTLINLSDYAVTAKTFLVLICALAKPFKFGGLLTAITLLKVVLRVNAYSFFCLFMCVYIKLSRFALTLEH